MDKVYIIIVNWNGWKDTIECLESVFRNDYPFYQVIICDNGSTDGSLEKIKAWAEGNLKSAISHEHPLYALSNPPVKKPVAYAEYTQKEAEAGGNVKPSEGRLILVRNPLNLGFAGGNNVGLRYALTRGDFSYVWLLNNDTVIKADALSFLVRRIREKNGAGMCGSLLPYYSAPSTIWALGGGQYNPWCARSRSIGTQMPVAEALERSHVESALDYLAGASMLVSREFLENIGLLSEKYFLYFEEPDWALRAKGKYTLAYAPESIVYHKVGASTRNFYMPGLGRTSSLFFAIQSHLRFGLKFFPLFLPFMVLRIVFQLILLTLKRLAMQLQLISPRRSSSVMRNNRGSNDHGR